MQAGGPSTSPGGRLPAGNKARDGTRASCVILPAPLTLCSGPPTMLVACAEKELKTMTINIGPVMVVEDIASVRELVQMQLRLRGYRVVAARDGEEALNLIAQERPAVIIADIL